MNIDEVKQLISLINESDIKNFEYAFDGGVVRISKNEGGFMAPSPAPAAMPVPAGRRNARTSDADADAA